MERLIEEIPNFFTIWNVIFLAKAMGVTFLLTAIGCIVGFSVGGLLAIFRKTKTIFTEFRFEPLNNTNVDASVRREYDSNYDIFDTGRIQVNHKLLRSMILRGSLGTGYRTPTPYELYSSYGNTNLTPEKSVSFDFGSEINLNKNKSTFYLGIFETKVEDIITYASSKYRQSTANLKTYGLESRFKTRLYDNLTASLNYTKTNGKENDGDSITLVPKDKAIISLNYTPTKKINMNTYYLFQNKAH